MLRSYKEHGFLLGGKSRGNGTAQGRAVKKIWKQLTKLMSLLPKELGYLETVAKELAKIPPDDLNEDVDASKLQAALRNRVKGAGTA